MTKEEAAAWNKAVDEYIEEILKEAGLDQATIDEITEANRNRPKTFI